MLIFEVPGKCIPKQRARRGRSGHFYTPPATTNYEKEVKWAAKIAMKGKTPISGYLQADIEVHCSVPPSYPLGKRTACLNGKRYPPTSDCDNLAKGLLDAMNGHCVSGR